MSDPDFESIRPYNDDEAQAQIAALLADPQFASAATTLLAPGLLRPLLRPLIMARLRRAMGGVRSIRQLQTGVVARPLERLLERTTDTITYSGFEQLRPGGAHLFVSNHRDIVMDPTVLNYRLHQLGHGTVRIAIGDNLLSAPFAERMMRLNKSFIVRRSKAGGPRQMLAELRRLSAYIRHSLHSDGENVWIAQREGRAKDGCDRTEESLVKMLQLTRDRDAPFADGIRSLNIVPMAISYEWDPCDEAKARELWERRQHGRYQKAPGEDLQTIARGMRGHKGDIHLALGAPLAGDYGDAAAVCAALDRAIQGAYRLHASNRAADCILRGGQPQGPLRQAARQLRERMAGMPDAVGKLMLQAYAAPLRAKK